jgi:hypothetical protein
VHARTNLTRESEGETEGDADLVREATRSGGMDSTHDEHNDGAE